MVTRMDRDIGRILALLRELDLERNTIVFFSSDNGPTFNGGTDSAFFDSNGPLRGLKCSVYEGGIRVPFIVRWPGRIEAGTTSDHVSAFWDMLPTIAELVGFETPAGLDGLSIAPTLLGDPEAQREHDYLYWEYHGSQALRLGRWKAVWRKNGDGIELYDLASDVGEHHDIAESHLDVIEIVARLFETARTESKHFPLKRD
jgi:arylsulfatase A-like enzyme